MPFFPSRKVSVDCFQSFLEGFVAIIYFYLKTKLLYISEDRYFGASHEEQYEVIAGWLRDKDEALHSTIHGHA